MVITERAPMTPAQQALANALRGELEKLLIGRDFAEAICILRAVNAAVARERTRSEVAVH